MKTQQAHGLSNGRVDDWSKVIRGRYEFFKLFCKKEKQFHELKIDAKNDVSNLRRFMEDYSEELHSLMIDDRIEPYYNVQRTDGYWLAERLLSGRFCRNNPYNFATVSTQILLIHKSGECLVTEHSYRHR